MVIKEGYKQTEIGIIPYDWEVNVLNEISSITRLAGYEYSTVWKETENGEIIALRGFNIGKNKIIERDLVRISNKLSMRLIRSRLFNGDVVYPCVGTIGNAVAIEEDDKYHIQQNIAKITPKKNKLNSKFLAHYLMSDFGFKEIEKFNGSSSQPNILVGSLRKYTILVPTLAEQTAIATALSDADGLITGLEKLISKKRNIKQGAMQQLLQPKEGWEVRKLGEVGKCLRGVSYNPERDLHSHDKNNTSRLLRSNNIKNRNLDFNNLQFVNIDRVKTHQFLQKGDIVICMANGSKQLVGKSAIFNIKDNIRYTFGAFMGCYRTDEKIASSSFISVNFQTFQYRCYIDVLLSGSSINNLNPSNIESIEIPFPPIEEQTRIAAILSDMDAELSALEQKLEKYKKVKLGMMQELLTGKTRLV